MKYLQKRTLRISLLVSLVLMLSLFLTSCGQDERKVVTFFFLANEATLDDGEAYYNQIIADFEQENPNVKVELVAHAWRDTKTDIRGVNVLNEMIAAGSPPTIAKVPTRRIAEYILPGHIRPVDEYLTNEFRAEFHEGLVEEGAQYQGRTFGLPIAYTARALYYNIDILAEAGITEPPTTWDELYAAAVAVGNLSGDVAGFGLQGDPTNSETSSYFYYFLWGNNGEVLTDDGIRAAFNGVEGVEALTQISELIDAGGTQAEPTADNRIGLETAFLEGRYAMIITHNGIAAKADEAGLNYGVVSIPGSKDEVSLVVTDSVVMFEQAPNQDEAWAFIEFMYQDKYRADNFQWEGVLPVKSTLLSDPVVSENPNTLFFLDLAKSARFEPVNFKSSDIAVIVGQELANVYLGTKTPQQALDDAAAQVNELLSYSATSW